MAEENKNNTVDELKQDKVTHFCIGVILSTGDNIDYFQAHEKEYIGQLDPKYEE